MRRPHEIMIQGLVNLYMKGCICHFMPFFNQGDLYGIHYADSSRAAARPVAAYKIVHMSNGF